ncbi:MAG: cytochrome d ubiquinol oxidase subunit 2 [Chlamydiota bacterium]|jgi:cytochrome d ubiquinol oxidase subunit II
MDLETLWYAVIGVAVLCYALLDGFDLGVGALLPFARNDHERRLFLNSIGPVWDGNEVWIVIVMGGLFAGFPGVYATLFSGFYTLLMFLIAALMFRAAAIEFRSKRPGPAWRQTWDLTFCISSVTVAFVLGIIMGNLIVGIPLDSEQNYIGSFTDLLNAYSILVGITSVALFAMHGAIYLALKTEGETHTFVRIWVNRTIAFFLIWYAILSFITVRHFPKMTDRLFEGPYWLVLPLLSILAILNVPRLISRRSDGWAFIFSCISIAFLLSLYMLGTYPILVPSSLDPLSNTLTIYNTASSHGTLINLLIVVAIGLPLVLGYGVWIYRIFRGKVQIGHTSY